MPLLARLAGKYVTNFEGFVVDGGLVEPRLTLVVMMAAETVS